MLKASFGLKAEPFHRHQPALLPQQQKAADIIQIHAQHGGFSVILGAPGVGKSVLRQHLQDRGEARDTAVACVSRTLHSYLNILKQLAVSLQIEPPQNQLEAAILQAVFQHNAARKCLYTLIYEAHLLDIAVLRKLRLLFDQFPKNHNLVLFGQGELMHRLSMHVHADIKSRITYSKHLRPLSDAQLAEYISNELQAVKLGLNVFDEGAIELILRSAQGNLRLCRNLCHASLIEACRDQQRSASIRHVNNVLIQPHWRSHEELIAQQVQASGNAP